MKIPVNDFNWAGGERYIVSLRISGPGFNFLTDAIIDTGSPWSIIMESDLKTKTRVPYSKLPTYKIVNLITQIKLLELSGDCKLIFRDVDNNAVQFSHKMYGGMFVNRNIQLTQAFPSFIGKDFLDKNNLFIGKRDENGKRHLEN
jgi:hypothetical protein